jgi:hypothetical protein
MYSKDFSQFKFPEGNQELSENFYREIYHEKEYDRYGIRVEEGDVVLDCGANIGIFSQYAIDMGASKVIGYECDPVFFCNYVENIEDPRIFKKLAFVGKDQHDIKKIITENNLDHIDFAKIDIEGHEWDMLISVDKEDLLKIKKLAVELHTFYYNEKVSPDEKSNTLWKLVIIMDKLTSYGYDVKIDHIHKGWDVIHLFAIRKDDK